MSPIHNFGTQNPYYQYQGSMIDQYASPDGHTAALKNPNSQFFRYLQSSRSHLASPSPIGDHQPSIGYKYHHGSITQASENSSRMEPSHRPRSPLLFRNTAVKVEEDVLVMDGVVVKNSPVDRARSSSSSLTDSGGSSPSLSSGGKNYKMDLCMSYLENCGYCRYGTKCQFAHGNKELRASKFPYKSMFETPCKSYNINGSKPTSTTQTMSPTKIDELTTTISNLKTTDWSPLDDGIDIRSETGETLSKEEIDARIYKVLNGPKKSKRLPVFVDICPE
ncbi:hypothetical protein L2E82_24851 [Cichorium intybus]|uniref:Uncharacterized protein n=1 Tax=Cichorium intybus TaxID=13427 RepID=A0ACB9E1D9_CICIN|nr:hypothetical protein L2E82_24851 [Cichorium intybus]